MNNFMVDIETLGNGHNGAIVSIGIVQFDPHSALFGDEFYVRIDLTKSGKQAGVIDPSTVEWWLQQSDAARAELTSGEREPLHRALVMMGAWLQSRGVTPDNERSRLWAKPPMFDERLLRDAYERCDLTFPFHWRASRDMRTLVDVGRTLGIEPREESGNIPGVPHNALYDATRQAHIVTAIYQGMRKSQ
jgi:hypothetical protein